ncbi:MAG: transposase [Chloracidobacterium sp.]|nr:transposase [Chloracidobacterium sp.]
MDCNLLACDGEENHLHLLVEYPPKLSVSVMVNAFKGHQAGRAFFGPPVTPRLRPWSAA